MVRCGRRVDAASVRTTCHPKTRSQRDRLPRPGKPPRTAQTLPPFPPRRGRLPIVPSANRHCRPHRWAPWFPHTGHPMLRGSYERRCASLRCAACRLRPASSSGVCSRGVVTAALFGTQAWHRSAQRSVRRGRRPYGFCRGAPKVPAGHVPDDVVCPWNGGRDCKAGITPISTETAVIADCSHRLLQG